MKLDDRQRVARISVESSAATLWDSGSYEYDALSEIRSIGVAPEPGTHPETFTHDAQGRLVMAELPGSSVAYGFDAFGNMSSRVGAPWPSAVEGGFSGRVFSAGGVHDNRIHAFCLVACVLLLAGCVRSSTSVPSAGAEPLGEECEAAVIAIQTAVARGDHAHLTSVLDDATNESLAAFVADECGGSTQRLMDVLNLAQHPVRFKNIIRIGPSDLPDGYRKVTLTAAYSYRDATYVPPCGEKPVELCVRFLRGSDGRVRAHLDFDFHDILYLLQ